jgi:hypothetical protein
MLGLGPKGCIGEAAFVFRRQLLRLFSGTGPLRRARFGPFEAEWTGSFDIGLARAEPTAESHDAPSDEQKQRDEDQP